MHWRDLLIKDVDPFAARRRRPKADRLYFEKALSKIAAMQKPSRICIYALIGIPLFVALIISGVASLLFFLPIWIVILILHPAWLIPLFIVGPVVSSIALYFRMRFVLWRRGETRP